jgi:hypothetical protein
VKWVVLGRWLVTAGVVLVLHYLKGGRVAYGIPDGPGPYFELTLTTKQRDWLLKELLKTTSTTATADVRKKVIEAVEMARPTDLVPARLDWDGLEAEADQQGISAADRFWDRASAKEAS